MWDYIRKKLALVVVTSMAVAGGGMQHHDARAAGAHGKLVPHTHSAAEHKDHYAAVGDVDTERFATDVLCERLSQSTSMSDGTGGDCCVASCSTIANIAFVAELSRPELRSILGAWSGNALLAADVRADDPPPR